MTKETWEAGCSFFLEAHGVEHFTATEVCPVGKTHKRSVLEAPPPDFMLTALKLIDVLEWIRWYQGAAPLHVNSWYRSTAYNRAWKGGKSSMHLTAGAADITKRGWSPERVALALHNDYPMADKLGIGVYGGFTHLDIRGLLGRRAPARWTGEGARKRWWLESAE